MEASNKPHSSTMDFLKALHEVDQIKYELDQINLRTPGAINKPMSEICKDIGLPNYTRTRKSAASEETTIYKQD